MPRSFLVKKKEKSGAERRHLTPPPNPTARRGGKDSQTDKVGQSPAVTSRGPLLLPLQPLSRAVLPPHYFPTTPRFQPWQDEIRTPSRDVTSATMNAVMFHNRTPAFSAITPYTPTIPPVAFTDYYRELLPPYSWYMHTLFSQPPSPTRPSEEDTEEDIDIDVEKVDDTCSTTPSVTSSSHIEDLSMGSPGSYTGSEETSFDSGSMSPKSQASDDSSQSTGKRAKGFQDGVTVGYTYEAFFISDGRSRKKTLYRDGGVGEGAGGVADTKQRYTCSICGKDYATSSNLSRHKQTHRNPESEQAKRCPHCKKVYVSMPALSMHILTHNLKHQCQQCGKAFSRPWLLQGHLRSHTGEKPYGCAHCGKAFADRSNLRAHMQTHSSYKQFKCKRCDKTFALKSYLNKHYESACFKDDPISLAAMQSP